MLEGLHINQQKLMTILDSGLEVYSSWKNHLWIWSCRHCSSFFPRQFLTFKYDSTDEGPHQYAQLLTYYLPIQSFKSATHLQLARK